MLVWKLDPLKWIVTFGIKQALLSPTSQVSYCIVINIGSNGNVRLAVKHSFTLISD
jgi:hypothetical protein